MPLTSTGYVVATIEEIQTDIENDLKAVLGPNLDVSATSVVGQIIGLFAEREYQLELANRANYVAFTPGGASGDALTQLAALTGTIRQDATFSTVTATLSLNAGVTVPSGSRVSVAGDDDAVFETTEDVTNGTGSADTFDTVMRAVEAGPVRANAGTLTQIVTPVSGWTAVTNAADATEGEPDESDSALRVRREVELRVQGSSNIDAIVADVRTVDGVVTAVGFENDTDVTVGVLPPHSFRVVLWDDDPSAADDDAIAQAIWGSKPVGIQSYGTESGTAVDAQGGDRTVAFDRATQREVYLEFDVTVDGDYPVDGDTQIKQAVVDYANENWTIGSDVILSALYGAVHSVSGVVSVDEIRAGFSASPVGTANLTIDDDEIARADTGRTEVTS